MTTANSTRAISGSVVVYTCMSGYEVPGGSTKQHVQCMSGIWDGEESLQACKSKWSNLINVCTEKGDYVHTFDSMRICMYACTRTSVFVRVCFCGK